eukprot:GEMP01089875.1.p1 GENE.GEMP01089875.1~~GEMP01089875.1.p1  ORF type:complete len:106 (-),score=0.83 GEMP01089875.1:271-588(-)
MRVISRICCKVNVFASCFVGGFVVSSFIPLQRCTEEELLYKTVQKNAAPALRTNEKNNQLEGGKYNDFLSRFFVGSREKIHGAFLENTTKITSEQINSTTKVVEI